MISSPESRESLARGYFWTFGSTALPLFSAFIVSVIVARWMGPRVVGLINWTMAAATIFLIPAKFGVEGAASRLASQYRVSSPWNIRSLVKSSIVLRLLFTIPVGAAAALSAPRLAGFFREEALTPLFRISGVMIVSVSVNELAALIIVGLKNFRMLFFMRSMMMVIRIGLVGASVWFAWGAAGVLGAYIAATLVTGAAVFTYLFSFRVPPPPGQPAAPVMRKLFRLSAPLAISGASVTIYSLLDKLMLGYYEGASQVGIYSMARNLLETSLFPTFALIMTLRPVLAETWTKGDLERSGELIRRSIRLTAFYSICVAAVFISLARPLIVGLFSEEFAASAGILVLFTPLVVMRSVGSVILPGLIAAERADTYARLTLTGAVLNFILNMLLIPRWGARGAVISTLISYMPIEIMGLLTLARAVPGFWHARDWAVCLKASAVAAVIAAAYIMLAPDPGNLVISIVHAAMLTVVYSAALIGTGAVTFRSIADLVRSLGGRNRDSGVR